jgi:hypothetical protein
MTTESVEFALSAKDNASAVFKETGEELKLLNDRVEQTSKASSQGTDAVGKLANALGVGWITDSTSQLKGLSDSVKSVSQSLKAGGSSAMVLKGGLVAITAAVSFKVGQIIGEWVFETKRWKEELAAAGIAADALQSKAIKLQEKKFARLSEAIDLTTDNETDRLKRQNELLRVMRKEIEGKNIAIAQGERDAAKIWDGALRKQAEDTNRRNTELRDALVAQRDAIEDSLQQTDYDKYMNALRDAEKSRQAAAAQTARETDAANSVMNSFDLQIKQMQMSADEYELMIALQSTSNELEQAKIELLVKQKQELAAQKAQQEEMAKQQAEAERQRQRDQEQREKEQQRMKLKNAEQRVRESEKAIDKFKADMEKTITTGIQFTSLSGSDSRLQSRAQNKIDYEARAFELQKQQAAYQKKQQELAVMMAAHLRLIADASKQQPRIFELTAGGF